jgi:hypothetical protein
MLLSLGKNSTAGAFPTIDLSSSPQVKASTAYRYWLLFLYRYYFVGRKEYGPYGSPWCIEQMRKIENTIKNESKVKGDAPTLPIPELKLNDISPEQFHEIYLKSNTPVVFRGAAKNWEAVQTWTPEFFAIMVKN